MTCKVCHTFDHYILRKKYHWIIEKSFTNYGETGPALLFLGPVL
jgi:hypothetical protein